MPIITIDSMKSLAQATLDSLDLWHSGKARRENPHAHLAFAGALHRHPGAWRREVAVRGLKATSQWSPRLDFVIGDLSAHGKTIVELTIRQEGHPNWYLLPQRVHYFAKTVRKLISYEHDDDTHMRYLVLIDRASHPLAAKSVINDWLEWVTPRIGSRGKPRSWESSRASFRLIYCSRHEVEGPLIRPYSRQARLR